MSSILATSFPSQALFNLANAAPTVPDALANAKEQFYNFLLSIAQGADIGGAQKLVLNSTIVPLDLALDTPYYNQQLFRLYADRTFRGGIETIEATPPMASATRFSAQYRVLINIAAAKIDQSHPGIKNSVDELNRQLTAAETALTNKNIELDEQWARTATARSIDRTSPTYELERVTWLAQIRYADIIARYSDDIDRLNGQLDAVRRGVYSANEIALLDNLFALGRAYNVARPWQAQTERNYKAQNTPLTEVLLADPTKLPPVHFDSSPLIFPLGDLNAFLTAQGIRSAESKTLSKQIDESTRSWSASGGGSFLGWSIGGGGSGSTSFSKSIEKMSSLEMKFENVAEYYIDRSAWFNPAVLQDKDIQKILRGRRELENLQYVAVSLIIARGLTMILKFSDKVDSKDWSSQSFSAQGGVSFWGVSIGGRGGNSSASTSIKVDESGTTVTFQDGPTVGRVLGVRVEPFITLPKAAPQLSGQLTDKSPELQKALEEFKSGKRSYIEFQKEKIKAIQRYPELK